MKMKLFKKAAVGAAVALAFAGSAFAAPVTITNGSVSATVNDSGTFDKLSYLGTEFVDWGIPMSYYWLNASVAGSPFVADNAGGSNPLSSTVTIVGSSVSFNVAVTSSLTFNQTISLIGTRAVVSVVLANTGSTAITGVSWGAGLDPDQARGGVGADTPVTTNYILGQGGGASVYAVDGDNPANGIVLRNTTDAGAFAVRAYLDGVCCSPVDPASILAGAPQALGLHGSGDRSMSLAYDIGTIAAGTSATIGYEYDFATPVPEPETYALMMAGLGLMAFVARRRKRSETV